MQRILTGRKHTIRTSSW